MGPNRRSLLKASAATVWVTPLVLGTTLPAHAQTSIPVTVSFAIASATTESRVGPGDIVIDEALASITVSGCADQSDARINCQISNINSDGIIIIGSDGGRSGESGEFSITIDISDWYALDVATLTADGVFAVYCSRRGSPDVRFVITGEQIQTAVETDSAQPIECELTG